MTVVVTVGSRWCCSTPGACPAGSGAALPVGIGGAESNVAIGLARLGVADGVSRVGDDAFGTS